MLDLSQALADISELASINHIPKSEVTVDIKTPVQSHVTGRSKRRQRRIRRRRDIESDTSGSEDEGIGRELYSGKMKSQGMKDEISGEERLSGMEKRLGEIVMVFKDGVEELAGGGDTAEGGIGEENEVWGMLSFALEDWREPRGIDQQDQDQV